MPVIDTGDDDGVDFGCDSFLFQHSECFELIVEQQFGCFAVTVNFFPVPYPGIYFRACFRLNSIDCERYMAYPELCKFLDIRQYIQPVGCDAKEHVGIFPPDKAKCFHGLFRIRKRVARSCNADDGNVR